MFKAIARRRWLAVVVPLFACSYMAAIDAYAASGRIANTITHPQDACRAAPESAPAAPSPGLGTQLPRAC